MNTVSMRIDEIESMAHRLVRENALLTKQRDIAVEALEQLSLAKSPVSEHVFMALLKIKEVE